jgi:hypothetical protein
MNANANANHTRTNEISNGIDTRNFTNMSNITSTSTSPAKNHASEKDTAASSSPECKETFWKKYDDEC